MQKFLFQYSIYIIAAMALGLTSCGVKKSPSPPAENMLPSLDENYREKFRDARKRQKPYNLKAVRPTPTATPSQTSKPGQIATPGQTTTPEAQ